MDYPDFHVANSNVEAGTADTTRMVAIFYGGHGPEEKQSRRGSS
ncbi:hypothetical protein [Paraburkholderia aromaticivorans]|nr:hypothetical protein [Paraburkholderia aromaticivorans]